MGILDFFRKKQKTDLIVKNETPIASNKKKVRNLVGFIEEALIYNGGNYEDIRIKLLTISEFAKHAREYGVQCNLSGVDEAIRDFFTQQSEIKFFPVKDKLHSAFYTKKDGWNRYNYRGITVFQDEQAKKPIMCYGRRNENAETHVEDTLFAFGDDVVIFRDENKANYDEIPLYGDGTYAEFSFDKENHLTKVKFRYMTHPRLGFWSKEQICEFDAETNQYKLLSTKIPERKYNDPKLSDKNRKIMADTLINMFDDQQENEDTFTK